MSAHLELVIPLIFAVNSAWTDYRECTGPTHKDPLVENMCGDLRLSLNDNCTALLSVPLGTTGLYLDNGISITQDQFSDITKKSIKASYESCTGFWSGTIDQDRYSHELLTNASTLTLLYRQLGPQFARKQNELVDMVASQGMSVVAFKEASKPEKVLENLCKDPKACTPTGVVTSQLPDDSLERRVRESVEAEINKTNARVAELERRLKQPLPPSVVTTRHSVLLTETTFATGKFNFQKSDSCPSFAQRIRPHYKNAGQIVVMGYADYRGDSDKNFKISTDRALAAAQCIADNLKLPLTAIIAQGKGILPVAERDLQNARKVTVHLETND